MRFLRKIQAIHIIIILFFFLNLIILTSFPFIHSDEAWLSGLSRNMIEKKELAVTEPFFDLYPRNPHAIKLTFHLIQIIFIKLMGYHIFTFRFISLLTGTAALYYFYKLAIKNTSSKKLASIAVFMLAIDIQFIYASHFARQEILLVLLLLIAYNYFLENYHKSNSMRNDIILGLILGAGIGIHPNSFVIALPFILIYFYEIFIKKKMKIRNFLTLIAVLGFISLFYIILSQHLNPNFIQDYSSYGETLGVFSSFLSKLDRLDYFYQKLFYRVSGTYYTPPIKFQFIFFSLAIIYGLLQLIITTTTIHKSSLIKGLHLESSNSINQKDQKSNYIYLFLLFLGINTAYVIIGRYNQTGIIFIFPISYLLVLNIISSLKKNIAFILITTIITILTFNTVSTLTVDTDYSYDNYLTKIAKVVNKEDKVLANLNSEYYFNNGSLLDYRNLAYLEENNLSFSEYIKTRKIKYIIYPEEMDFIYNNRPVWNILYGNLFTYYQEMKDFLEEECNLVHSFTNQSYGIRIARFVGKKEWSIKIYRVIFKQ